MLTCVSAFTLQLSVGLYTFRVAVSSENAFGEGYVNVTVLPGESVGEWPLGCAGLMFWHLMSWLYKLST